MYSSPYIEIIEAEMMMIIIIISNWGNYGIQLV